MCTERNDQWLAEERVQNETGGRSLQLRPRTRIVEWILESWNSYLLKLLNNSLSFVR